MGKKSKTNKKKQASAKKAKKQPEPIVAGEAEVAAQENSEESVAVEAEQADQPEDVVVAVPQQSSLLREEIPVLLPIAFVAAVALAVFAGGWLMSEDKAVINSPVPSGETPVDLRVEPAEGQPAPLDFSIQAYPGENSQAQGGNLQEVQGSDDLQPNARTLEVPDLAE